MSVLAPLLQSLPPLPANTDPLVLIAYAILGLILAIMAAVAGTLAIIRRIKPEIFKTIKEGQSFAATTIKTGAETLTIEIDNVNTLKQRYETLVGEYTSLRREHSDITFRVDDLERQNNNRANEIAGLKEQNMGQQQQLDELRRRAEVAELERAAITAQLQLVNNSFEIIRPVIELLQRQITGYRTTFHDAFDRISVLVAQLDAKLKEAAHLLTTHADADQTFNVIAEAQQMVMDLAQAVGAFRVEFDTATLQVQEGLAPAMAELTRVQPLKR